VIEDPVRFSSAGWEERFLERLPTGAGELYHVRNHYSTSVMSMADPPMHARLRTPVARSFTPRVLEEIRPRIARLAGELLDRLGDVDHFDVLADFAYPLPALVIAELLGAPQERREDFVEWSRAVVDFVGTGAPEITRAQRVDAALASFRSVLVPLIEERRAAPRDDLLSLLVADPESKGALSEDELVAAAVVILFAGHETTANLIANGLLALLEHPREFALLRASQLVDRRAIEELLRYDSPVQRNRRVATQDLTFHGARIRAGDQVMAFLGSANRDQEYFSNPDRLDLGRTPNQHLAFGHGIHYCLGAALTRIEAPIALEALFERFPSLAKAPDFEPRRRPNITFRGLESLVVDVADRGSEPQR
jgi:cytochrome P450